MELSLDDMTALVGDFFWPFLRISALFAAAPVFSARTVPVRVRIILAVFITLLIRPSLPYLELVEPLSARGLLLILQQLSIGIVMGLILQIVMGALVMAGQAIATTMGLGFASSVDPQNGVQVTMLGQLYLIIGTLYLLAVDGHLLLIDVLVQSFVYIPVGSPFNALEVFGDIALFASELFVAALLIALPVIVGVLLVNLAFGVVTRAAPQLNIFAVGFPVTMLAGFILILFSLPVLFPTLGSFFTVGFNFMRTLVN
ncbi:MAG: flagellar biosynthetic protein FliR [Gammaproteobacteria bacterium]|jgi:flagellar biosynthetic protein FliR